MGQREIGSRERYNRAEEKPELVEQLTKRMRKMAAEVGVKTKPQDGSAAGGLPMLSM